MVESGHLQGMDRFRFIIFITMMLILNISFGTAIADTNSSIRFTYYSGDLDDDGNGNDWFASFINGTRYNASKLSLSPSGVLDTIVLFNTSTMTQGTGLWHDTNGNGKLGESADYIQYNGFFVIDDNTLQPVLELAGDPRIYPEADSTNGFFRTNEDGTYKGGLGWLGAVFKIKGQKYVLTRETSNYHAEFASAKVVTLANKGYSGNLKDYAASIFNGKLAWQKDDTNKSAATGTLFIMDADGNTQKTISVNLGTNSSSGDVYAYGSNDRHPNLGMIKSSTLYSTSFEGYRIFLKNASANGIKVVVGKEGEFAFGNNMESVLGYSKLFMSMGAGVANPEFSLIPDNKFIFFGPATNLVSGDTVNIAGADDYAVRLDLSKQATIKRVKSATVSDGTKMKTTNPDYVDFVITDTSATISGSNVNLRYGSPDLDDDDNAQDWFASFINGTRYNASKLSMSINGVQGTIVLYNTSTMTQGTGLWFDANGNGKLGESVDYIHYNGFYVADGTTLRPVLDMRGDPRIYQEADSTDGIFLNSEEGIYGAGAGGLGGVFKIKGNKYVITNETSNYGAGIASARVVTLADKGSSGNVKDYAATIFDGKLAWQKDDANKSAATGTLFILDADGNTEKTITVNLGVNSSSGDIYAYGSNARYPNLGMIKSSALSGTSYAGYKIFLKNASANGIKVIGGNEGEFNISNNMDNAFNYSKLYLSMGAGVVNPEFSILQDNKFLFMGPATSLVMADTVDIAGTMDYWAKLDFYNQATIERTRTISVSSGTTMKISNPDYGAIFKTDTTVMVLSKPDLYIIPGEISFSSSTPRVGEPLNISVLPRNLEKDTQESFIVSFFNGDPYSGGALITSSITTVGNTTVVSWTPSSEGTYDIHIVLDSGYVINESDETNNIATKQVHVSPQVPDLEFTYYSLDLDDDNNAQDWFASFINGTATNASALTTSSSGHQGTIILYNSSTMTQGTGLWYDANGNGRMGEFADHILYNGFYVVDDTILRPVLDISSDPRIYQKDDSVNGFFLNSEEGTYGGGKGGLGMVFKVRGSKYVLTKEISNFEAEFAPARVVKLANKGYSGNLKDYAAAIFGGKMAWQKDNTNKSAATGTLFIMDADGNTEKTITVNLGANSSSGDIYVYGSNSRHPDLGMIKSSALSGTSYAGYKVFLRNASADALKVIVGKEGEFTMNNNMNDALGYDKFYMSMSSGVANPFLPIIPDNHFVLVGGAIDLVAGDTVDIPDTDYAVKLDLSKTATTLRAKTVTAPSGTRMKTSHPDYGNFLSKEIKATVSGSNINIEYISKDLDGDNNAQDWFASFINGTTTNASIIRTSSSGHQGTIVLYNTSLLSQGTGLWYDANGNGKMGESSDYILYNGFYVVDDSTIQPVLDLGSDPRIYLSADSADGFFLHSEESTYGVGVGWLGAVFKIKGNKYLLTKEVSNYEAEIASAKTVTLADKGVSGNIKDYAATIFGGKMAWQKDSTNKSAATGTLFILDADGNTEKTITVNLGANSSSGDVYAYGGNARYPNHGMIKSSALSGTSFAGYKVFMKNATADGIKVIVGKEGEFTLSNNMDNAMGYSKLYMSMGAGVANPEFAVIPDNKFVFLGSWIDLLPGEYVDIPDSDYQAKFDYSKWATIFRVKSVAVSSGTKMKTSHPDYGSFLSKDTTISIILSNIYYDFYCDNDSDSHTGLEIAGNCTGINCIPVGCQGNPGDDCNDSNPLIHPGAPEMTCDGIDNDCNALTQDNPGEVCDINEDEWVLPIRISSGNYSQVVTLGTADSATDGFDPLIDVLYPPQPPGSNKYSYFRIDNFPPFDMLMNDSRPVLNQTSTRETWRLNIASDEGLYLSWDPSTVPEKVLILDMEINGTLVDMRNLHNYTLESGSYNINITADLLLTIPLKYGWNMISLPVENANMTIPPTIIQYAYLYNPSSGGYELVPVEDMQPGKSYWVAAIADSNVSVMGTPLNSYSSNLSMGWNMIGSVWSDVATADIITTPTDSILPYAYWYDPGSSSYQLTTKIERNKGYWAAAINSCQMDVG